MLLILKLLALPGVLALVQPNNVGKLPALGWNSWNAFHCDITEADFLTAAHHIVSSGLKDAGYTYVNIDDCWSVKSGRDQNNRLVPDPKKFPDGIKGTADKIHQLGLKMGIYSSAGLTTCAGYPASLGFEDIDQTFYRLGLTLGLSSGAPSSLYGHGFAVIREECLEGAPPGPRLGFDTGAVHSFQLSSEANKIPNSDAQTWAEWGIDYLKYDNCGVPKDWQDTCNGCVPDPYNGGTYVNGTCINDHTLCASDYDYRNSKTAQRYRRMRDALQRQKHTILYSLCDWGNANVKTWGMETGNSWRSTNDIADNWGRITNLLNQNSFYLNYGNFWGHSDADMLEIGNGGLTLTEQRSHFALWAAMKSPLLIGTALDKLAPESLDILKNKYLLAFNQDPVFGASAKPYNWDWSFNPRRPAEYWSGHSSQGTLVLMFNPLGETVAKHTTYDQIPGLTKGGSYRVVNVWSGIDHGCIKDGINAWTLGSHDTAAYLVQEGCGSKIDNSITS